MANLSLLDLVARTQNDPLTGLIEDVTIFTPEFSQVPVVTRLGVTYKIVKRTALPASGFRDVNQGLVPGKSAYKQEVKQMFFLDAPLSVDEAIVYGDDRSAGDILAQEAQGVLQSALITVGVQTYYGTSADSLGFKGLRDQVSGVQKAGGTTNSTSAFLLWFNPQGVHYDVGRDGEIAVMPWQRLPVFPTSTTTAWSFQTNLKCWIGLTVGSSYSVWAITGITTHTTTSLTNSLNFDQAMSDQTAAALVRQIPINRRAGLVWMMNRTSHYVLQATRTAINYQPAGAANGAGAWSPPPTMCEGYPIVVTDAISDTETNA